MDAQELRSALDDYRKALSEKKSGAVVMSSPSGPIGISIIENIVQAIEEQERRIERLEQQVKG